MPVTNVEVVDYLRATARVSSLSKTDCQKLEDTADLLDAAPAMIIEQQPDPKAAMERAGQAFLAALLKVDGCDYIDISQVPDWSDIVIKNREAFEEGVKAALKTLGIVTT